MKKHLIWGAMAAALCIPFTSCSNDDDKDLELNKTSYTLHHDQEVAIDGTGLDGVTWTSENDWVAYVEDNKIQGQYVGSTTINSKNHSITVQVTPVYNSYKEPVNEFGMTKAEVMALYPDAEPYIVNEDGVESYSYAGNGIAYVVTYLFNAQGVVSGTGVAVDYSDGTELTNFLCERYPVIENNTVDKYILYAKLAGTLAAPQNLMAAMQELDDSDPDSMDWIVSYVLGTNTRAANDAVAKAVKAAKEAFK